MQIHQDAQHTLSKRFKIKRLLGKGSFGNVYECQEKKTSQIYAVKIISKINVKRSKIECLREEATLLLSLDHPNIVKVYQFFQDQQVIFIKMEYVRMGTLGQLMKQRELGKHPFSDEEAAQIMGSIFNAVNYIHSLSILHRDIKPENILIQDKHDLGKLKIADFGLGAKLQFRSPTATSKCGTYLFMAPQIMWNYTYTKAVDVWSCAIIMYMLKKRSHPFYQSGMTNEQFKQKIKHVVFPSLDDPINPQLNDNQSPSSSKLKFKPEQNFVLNKKKALLAQDLLRRISKLSPNERYTAQDAIKHPWITRNFDDEIPLSLHDSFQGFQVSHEISLMMKMFLMLKNINYKKQTYEKARKNDIFERYSRHCEQVNRKDRSVSPLKVRRLSSVNNSNNTTRQIRELCELSQIAMSPKKSNKQVKQVTETNDTENPTIMKLNKIFNNLFDKKERKTMKNFNVANEIKKQGESSLNDDLNQNNLQKNQKCFQYKEVPDMTGYKSVIEKELQLAVKERNKRKKQRILPLRKKNQYGELIGVSCDVKKCLKGEKEKSQPNPEKKQEIPLKALQIGLFKPNRQTSSPHGKVRVRRKLNNNAALYSMANQLCDNKFIT